MWSGRCKIIVPRIGEPCTCCPNPSLGTFRSPSPEESKLTGWTAITANTALTGCAGIALVPPVPAPTERPLPILRMNLPSGCINRRLGLNPLNRLGATLYKSPGATATAQEFIPGNICVKSALARSARSKESKTSLKAGRSLIIQSSELRVYPGGNE